MYANMKSRWNYSTETVRAHKDRFVFCVHSYECPWNTLIEFIDSAKTVQRQLSIKGFYLIPD